MAPFAISHFTHPTHKLNQLTTNTSFICDGCKLLGTGSRFTCTICNFDLHDYCAECPEWLTSTAHHQHPMRLVVHRLQTQSNCQICLNPVEGLAYVCKDDSSCNFWVHPTCVNSRSIKSAGYESQQPRTVPSSSAAHTFQNIGEQVGIGLGTNFVYDAIKPDDGFFNAIKSGLKSLFEGSMDKDKEYLD